MLQPEDLGGPHHREVVDDARDRQPADVAAGKEQRLDDVRIGGEDQPSAANPHRRAIVHRPQPDAAGGFLGLGMEGRQE